MEPFAIAFYVYFAFFAFVALAALFYPADLVQKLNWMILATWPGNILVMSWSGLIGEDLMFFLSFVIGFLVNTLLLWFLVGLFQKLGRGKMTKKRN